MTRDREVTGGVPRYRWGIAVAVVSAVTMPLAAAVKVAGVVVVSFAVLGSVVSGTAPWGRT